MVYRFQTAGDQGQKENPERNQSWGRVWQELSQRETKIRISADFASQIIQARREWNETFKVLKGGKKHQLFFKSEGKIEIFLDEQKLRELINNRTSLK